METLEILLPPSSERHKRFLKRGGGDLKIQFSLHPLQHVSLTARIVALIYSTEWVILVSRLHCLPLD